MKFFLRHITAICLLLVYAGGCVAPAKQTLAPARSELESRAREYLAEGNYTAAADEYIRLAETNKSNADPFLLKAADAYLAANDPDLAQSTMFRVREKELTHIQSAERRIIHARIALLRKNPDTALFMLDFPLPQDLPRDLAADYHSSHAQAFEMKAQFISAVRARILLTEYLDGDEETSLNYRSIWNLLKQAAPMDLVMEAGDSENELAGWLELAMIANNNFDSQSALNSALDAWHARHDSHPAATHIVPDLLAAAAASFIKPHNIALLLPFNGQYHDAAAAIRDGFLAAWYEEQDSPDKPLIRIYNTANQDILGVYNRAVADGADFIVGPLEKEAVTTLLNTNNLKVRVLALNQINGIEYQNSDTAAATIPSLFQFGLLPEDETFQVAERAWSKGLANALVITPDSSWGERIYNAFNSRWLQLGGKIVKHVKIPDGSVDYAQPVKLLLNIDKSEARAKRLTALLGKKIHAEPRHRQDADLIFLAATPLVARQIVPQFRFFGMHNIAIYSSSSVYSGISNPEADSDINGVIFTDMPWVVNPEIEQSPLQQALNRNFSQNNSAYRRLYALGIDAWHLVPGLGDMVSRKISQFTGVTGRLHLTSNGVLRRNSTWVQVVKGSPQILDNEQTAE